MAGGGVTHVEGDIHHAHLRLAQQSPRFVHPQLDLMARRRDAHGAVEEAPEVKLTEPRLRRQLGEAEVFGDVVGYPVRYLWVYGGVAQPNVNAKASAPGSRNSISNRLSVTGFGCRIN
jgi:hypothetical protein